LREEGEAKGDVDPFIPTESDEAEGGGGGGMRDLLTVRWVEISLRMGRGEGARARPRVRRYFSQSEDPCSDPVCISSLRLGTQKTREADLGYRRRERGR
jgi:hypothetical protein